MQDSFQHPLQTSNTTDNVIHSRRALEGLLDVTESAFWPYWGNVLRPYNNRLNIHILKSMDAEPADKETPGGLGQTTPLRYTTGQQNSIPTGQGRCIHLCIHFINHVERNQLEKCCPKWTRDTHNLMWNGLDMVPKLHISLCSCISPCVGF